MTQPHAGSGVPPLSGGEPQGKATTEFQAGEWMDDFEILDEVGRGGMGIVYRAYEHPLRRVVALKVLNANIASNASMGKRFRREAILAANLSHAHIVPIFHVDGREPPRYFTMEFVRGKSLRDKVEASGYLEPEEALRIAIQVCEALQCAHEHNTIHRDIKPSNILLENDLERVRVTDFGIARDLTGHLSGETQTGEASFGTPAYMSPEQNQGGRLGKTTDVYSLGATVYYMLTGRPPHRPQNRAELAVAHRRGAVRPPSTFNPKVSRALDSIVLKMLAPDPRARYPDCRSVSEALAGLQAGGRLVQPDKGSGRTPWQAHKRLILATAAGAMLLVFGIWIWDRTLPLRTTVKQPDRGGGSTTEAGARSPVQLFSDRFSGPRIDETLWRQGASRNKFPGRRSWKIIQQDGALLLESRAEHMGGWSCTQAVWVEATPDLKVLQEKGEQAEIGVDFEGEASGGSGSLIKVMIADANLSSHSDLQSACLFNAKAEKSGAIDVVRRSLKIMILRSSGYAIVCDQSQPNVPLRVVDISRLPSWHLRFCVSAATSAGFTPSRARLVLHGVTITRRPTESGVIGRVLDAKTKEGIAGATVTNSDASVSTTSGPNGHFQMVLPPGPARLKAGSPDYEQSGRMALAIPDGGRVVADIPMNRFRYRFGDVVSVIPCGSPNVESFVLDAEHVYYGEGKTLFGMRKNGEGFAEVCSLPAAKGLTLARGKFYAVDVWPGRLYELEAGQEPRLVRHLQTHWPRDLSYDGKHIWYVENNRIDGEYGVHALEFGSWKPVIHLPTQDSGISGVAWGGGSLWVSSTEGKVYEVDLDKARLEGLVEAGIVQDFSGQYEALFHDGAYLWGLKRSAGRICRISVANSRAASR